jgi:hypothetical protein
MAPDDIAYLLFSQAIPSLDGDQRLDVVDTLNSCDFDVAIDMLVYMVSSNQIAVDADLLNLAVDVLRDAGLTRHITKQD